MNYLLTQSILKNQSFILVVAIIFMVISILYQVTIGVMYQRMIQATDTMTGVDNKLLKQCKERFIRCYQLNGGVPNIPVFVDKFINRIQIMGMSMNFVKHLSGQLMLAGVFIAGFGVCKGIVEGERFVDLLPFYIVSLFGIYLFLSVSAMVDMQARRQALKTNLTDYLENHIAERLEHGMANKEKLMQEMAQAKMDFSSEKEFVKQDEDMDQDFMEDAFAKENFSSDEAKELEELLKSFMV